MCLITVCLLSLFQWQFFFLTCLSVLCIQEADCQFEFCVKDDADSGLSGCWMEDDVEMSPYRRVLLLQANKLDPLIERIKTFLTQQQ